MPLNDCINESQISIFSNPNKIKNKKENENGIQKIIKEKLETVREVNSEFSQSNYHKQLSKQSSNTEKIDSERCVENYDKKTIQLMKYYPRKNNYSTNEYFGANSYNIIEHKSSFFMKHSENTSEDDVKYKIKKNTCENIK